MTNSKIKTTPEDEPFQSGMPPAQLLSEYEKLMPGSAKELLDLAMELVRHQIKKTDDKLQADIIDRAAERNERQRGQMFGLIIGVVAIISGAVTASLGSEWSGGAIGTGGVIGLVAIFVFRRDT